LEEDVKSSIKMFVLGQCHTPLYFHIPKPSSRHTPYVPIPRNPPQTPKTPSEKYREKTLKSRNGANPDSKWSILKYCTQKPAQIQKTPKESYKGNKPPQVSKGNPRIVKNKAIRKGSKSCKRSPIHIKEIIAEISPIQKSNRPKKHSHKSEKTEKMPKYRNIEKIT
jgi:hypothetical protein